MIATIFQLESQQHSCDEIESLLRRYVFEDIQVSRLTISDDYNENNSKLEDVHCWRYVNLLKACMVRVDDFSIVVADGQGNSWYMGGEGYGYGYQEGLKFLNIFHDSLPSAFPAVAIMGRMVMVPQGIHEAFEKSLEFSWFLKPLDLGGVLLVDFRDPESVREGTRQVGIRLKTEIGRLCARHMWARKIPSRDFDELAALLNIKRKYLEQNQDEILVPITKLTPKIVSGSAQLETPSRVVLEIQNESDTLLERVRVQVRAPFGVLQAPVVQTLDFPTGEAGIQRIQFEVVTKTSPYCPLEVFFAINETNQAYSPFPIPLILDVSFGDTP
jgi:hypothetical protein